MKTMFFCTCWLDSSKYIPSHINWYLHHVKKFDQNTVFYFFDDGSCDHILQKFLKQLNVKSKLLVFGKDSLKESGEKVVVVSLQPHLGRNGMLSHTGWWRSFLTSYDLAVENNYDKIIHVEADFYILSKRMADYMNGLISGWQTGWCKKHNFIETAIQVICKDAFDAFGNFSKQNRNDCKGLLGRLPENIISRMSSRFNISFSGDRIGEWSGMSYTKILASNFDYYGQMHRSYFFDKDTEKRNALFKIIDFVGSFEKHNKSLLIQKIGPYNCYGNDVNDNKRHRLLASFFSDTKRAAIFDTLEIINALDNKPELKNWLANKLSS